MSLLVREIPFLDPLRAFAALRTLPAPVLLDSARLDPGPGRWSWVAADPFLFLSSRDGRIRLGEERRTGDPWTLLERHPTIHHLVSTVTGELEAGTGPVDLLQATFPGDSITGAPKIRAMEIIAGLEPDRRGPYCGAILWLGLDRAMDSAIGIRTFAIRDRTLTFAVGGGIIAASEPAAEYEETLAKARAPLQAVSGEGAGP